MINKTSAHPDEIVKGLDPNVVKKAQAISISKKYQGSLFQQPLQIPVGDYVVTLEVRGSQENPDVFLTCTCDYWRYQGPEYHAVKNNYLHGIPRGTAEEPKSRDPKGTHRLCKHAYAVLKTYF